jgi:hypothetical protein
MNDLLIIWIFILTPLVLFLASYIVETYVSIKRLTQPAAGRSYLPATWEITHTFLVVSVALFVGFFSQNLTEIAYVTFYPLFLTAVFVGVRTLAYMYLFIIRDPAVKARSWVDIIFAGSHLGVICGLVYLLVALIPKLLSIQLAANTSFIPWMIPGAFLILAACALPIVSLYRKR